MRVLAVIATHGAVSAPEMQRHFGRKTAASGLNSIYDAFASLEAKGSRFDSTAVMASACARWTSDNPLHRELRRFGRALYKDVSRTAIDIALNRDGVLREAPEGAGGY